MAAICCCIRVLKSLPRYSRVAQDVDEEESCVRVLPLMVLLYESIIEGVFDFDYAPCPCIVSYKSRAQRMWLNISQDGKAAIEEFTLKGFTKGIKLTSSDFLPIGGTPMCTRLNTCVNWEVQVCKSPQRDSNC